MYFRVVPRSLALVVSIFSASAYAQSTGEILAQESKCLACHQVDKRRVGPPFSAVAQRFDGQAGALNYLAGVIQHGGRGQWGAIPMPRQPHVDAAQAVALAQWILSLAKQENK